MGPLKGLRVVEIAGIGPAPFCVMLLADMGADVLRIDRPGNADLGLELGKDPRFDVMRRGRSSVALDLKKPDAITAVLRMVEQADVLIEGFRPGAMERLGLGPVQCLEANPRLVYGRMTGWGQSGPKAKLAGHDINYIAAAGVLHGIGQEGTAPVPPLNLVGDFGGGAMFLAFGVLAALIERQRSGKGQIVDAAMVEGASYLASAVYGLRALGMWSDERGANVLDSGAPWYDTYECADGKYVAIGPVERRFFEELLTRLGIDRATFPKQFDRARWPEMREEFARIFRGRKRDEWCAVMQGSDACFAPVLDMGESPKDEHNRAREMFISLDGVVQPAPTPKFSRSVPAIPTPPSAIGANADGALREWGFESDEIDALRESGVLGMPSGKGSERPIRGASG